MTELNSVKEAISNRLAAQRVVFWHDPSGEYDADVETLKLGAVTVTRLHGNEFGVKGAILADHVTRHLVYRSGEMPRGTSNWLLDLELAYGVFTADKTSMLQQELGIDDPALAAVIEQHQSFFGASSRKLALSKLLASGDDAAKMRAKMSQVLVKSSGHTLTDIIRELLAEYAVNKRVKFDDLVTFGLDQFLWDGLAKIYKYSGTNPTIDDFVLWIYSLAIDDFASETPGEFRNIRIDFNSLRYDVRTQGAMATLASRAADALDLKSKIEHRDFRELVAVTIFEEIDRKVIVDLAAAVVNQSVTPREVAEIVRQRQDSLWKDKYAKLYEATHSASELLASIAALPSTIPSMDAGLQQYQSDWFRIDQQYRWFTFAYQTGSSDTSVGGFVDLRGRTSLSLKVSGLSKVSNQRSGQRRAQCEAISCAAGCRPAHRDRRHRVRGVRGGRRRRRHAGGGAGAATQRGLAALWPLRPQGALV